MSLSTDQENERCFKLFVLSQVWCMWLDACTRWAVSTVLCACGRSTVTTRWWTAGRAWAACRTVDRRSGPLCSTDSCTLLEALTAAQVCCYAFFICVVVTSACDAKCPLKMWQQRIFKMFDCCIFDWRSACLQVCLRSRRITLRQTSGSMWRPWAPDAAV